MTAPAAPPKNLRANPGQRRAPGVVAGIGHVLRHHGMRLRAQWWTVVTSALVQPTVFLLAVGAGIGTQIDEGELARLGADSYIAWLGPGILAVTALEIGAREAMWPTMAMLRWQGTYRTVLRTPISVGTLAVGHLFFIATRALVSAVCFMIVLALFGIAATPWAVLVPFMAGAVAIVHASPIIALTVSIDQDHYFPPILRMVIFPLFLFSGAFFPVEDMPGPLAAAAKVLPSWHAVEASRDLTLGQVDDRTWLHVVVLVAVAAVAAVFARAMFIRKVEA